MVTSVRLQTLGNFLSKQLFPQFNSTIGLLDRNGIILYATNAQQYVGELNIERVNLNELISDVIEDPTNQIEKTNKDHGFKVGVFNDPLQACQISRRAHMILCS